MEAESSLLCSEEQANCLYLMSQMNPVHTVLSCFRKINFNIILQSSSGLPRGLLLRFSHQNFVRTSLQCVTHAVLISSFFDFIMPTVFLEEYKLWSSYLCNFLQLSFTSTSQVQISLISPCSHTTPVYFFFSLEWDQVSHPYNTTGKISVLYILIKRFQIAHEETEYFEFNCSKHYPNFICS